ncbi:VanZ family protein [uncultured Microbacterium sp.]|uniref:VanZ family protein n=1 Tax=uncultured Microbacterium sp. TaxID=191216 RepID=UPI002636B00B|nr:VanZ family protein [uncultured Microbacterium sp.]
MTDPTIHVPPRPPLPPQSPSEPTGAKRPASLARNPRTYLAIYLAILAAIAFWPSPVDQGAGPLLRAITRLIPALTYPRIEFAANIALFIPLGLLLTLIFTTKRWLVMPIAFVATVTIECVQALALGARTPSLLDIVANTAGACVGILLAVLVETLRDSRTTPPPVSPK